jgi:hypothetical protein
MASKIKLQGSFGSLIDTLTVRLDPFIPEDLFKRWLAALARCASIARNTGAWDRLPAEDDRYDAVIQKLDRATRAVVNADLDDPQSISNALDAVDDALDDLEALL